MNIDAEQVKLGQRIKELRLKAGHTSQERFAYENDFARVLFMNWERGKGNITYSNLLKVCYALRVSLSEFFQPFNAKTK